MGDGTTQSIILERGALDRWFARWPLGATSTVVSRELIRDMVDAMNLSERLQKERRWIPVSERLPEENVQVLAYSPDDEDGDLHVCSWGVERKPFMEPRGYFSRLDFKTIWGVTHWMPLPSPPEVK